MDSKTLVGRLKNKPKKPLASVRKKENKHCATEEIGFACQKSDVNLGKESSEEKLSHAICHFLHCR